jgi:hypothetical protein
MKQNKLVWIAAVVIVVIVGGYVVWSKKAAQKISGGNQSAPTAQNNQNQNKNDNLTGTSGTISEDSALSDENADEASPEEKRSDEKPDEAFREQIITYVNQNLNKLATPPANDKWDTPTFYFVGNSNVYVELYALDTDLAGAKMLYKASKDSGGAIKLAEVARFKEGEDDWILASGKDTYADYVMEEYDLNEDTNKWEKTDEFSDQSDSNDDSSDLGSSAPSGQIIQ